jgi:hypothetical protein
MGIIMNTPDPSVKHPDYIKYFPEWQKIRDVVAGEADVKDRGTTYLPRELGMTPRSYNAYRDNAYFLAACDRTLKAFVGLIHRKPPTIIESEVIPEEMWNTLTRNFTRRGMSLDNTALYITDEVAQLNRVGVLLDYPTVKDGMTKLEFEQRNILPYVRVYKAEDIINWEQYETGNGKEELSLVVLYSPYKVKDPDNEFTSVNVERYYVHDLTAQGNPEGKKYVYRKRVFTRNDKNSWDVEEGYPVINGELQSSIPFWFAGGYGLSEIERSSFLALADTDLKHYRLSASLNWGLKFVALPTPYATGINNAQELKKVDPISGEEGIPIGPSVFHVVNNPDAKFGLLEYTGKGLELIQKEIENRRDEMAMLGSRLLTSEKRQVETAETARIYRTGENAALTLTAKTVSQALTNCLRKAFEWMGIDKEKLREFEYNLNEDYLPTQMDGNLFQSLFTSYLQGALPLEDFFDKLKEGEMLSPDREYEDFKNDLKESRKYLGVAASPTNGTNGFGGNTKPEDTSSGDSSDDSEDPGTTGSGEGLRVDESADGGEPVSEE